MLWPAALRIGWVYSLICANHRLNIREVRDASSRPGSLNPVATPRMKNAQSSTPATRGLHPDAAVDLLRLTATASPPPQPLPLSGQPDFRFQNHSGLRTDTFARKLH